MDKELNGQKKKKRGATHMHNVRKKSCVRNVFVCVFISV